MENNIARSIISNDEWQEKWSFLKWLYRVITAYIKKSLKTTAIRDEQDESQDIEKNNDIVNKHIIYLHEEHTTQGEKKYV